MSRLICILMCGLYLKPKTVAQKKFPSATNLDVAWFPKNDVLNKNPEKSIARMLKKKIIIHLLKHVII
ncbi:MAG: hypothetical protein Ct9H300mP29_5700 [Candidatus Neomarinimicrobiota bacterium]|nr:MAG: hypothetical protein Ct9H300mP29_5700 [Candidatus Neomarinimicrobiota bacterium]